MEKGSGLILEFREFVYEHRVMGVAVAFSAGAIAAILIQSLVNEFTIPIIGEGSLASVLITLAILSLIIILAAKIFGRKEK